jgi:hypothetical protein
MPLVRTQSHGWKQKRRPRQSNSRNSAPSNPETTRKPCVVSENVKRSAAGSGVTGDLAGWIELGPIFRLALERLVRAWRQVDSIDFLIQVDHGEILSALAKNCFYGGRNPPLLAFHLIVGFLFSEPEVAAAIFFDEINLEHALEDGHGPVFIFAVSPFAAGPAADFLT